MRFIHYSLILLVAISFSSCKIFRSNLMLKTPKDYTYDKLADSLSKQDYRIEGNDVLQVRIFSNDGFKIIDLANTAANFRLDLDYIVDRDGTTKLPLTGKVKLSGLTIREAEVYLEEVYDKFYVKPYVTVKVTNKRVIVFPGNGGVAKVLSLTNNNTTVIEALALTGGVAEDGKAYKVKLIRNDGSPKPKVYLMDLSKIEGIAAGNSVVLANDIIYVEPRYRLAKTLVAEVAPIISLLTSTILIYTIFVKK
jgi:polysaccharide export outer membrane protein